MPSTIALLIPIGFIVVIVVTIAFSIIVGKQRKAQMEELNAAQPPLERLSSFSSAGRLLADAQANGTIYRPRNYGQLFGILVVLIVLFVGVSASLLAENRNVARMLNEVIADVNAFIQRQLILNEVPRQYHEGFIVGVYVGLGLLPFVAFYTLAGLLLLQRALTWRRAEGVMARAYIHSFMRGSGKSRTQVYQTVLRAAYRSDTGVHWVERHVEGWGRAARAMRRYRVGEPVQVWYNPRKPEQALVRQPLTGGMG